MADVFSRRQRSLVMSRVRGKGNLATEVRLVSIFRLYKITGWRRHQRLFGRPDFIFRGARVAIFVDGCFWHSCPKHGSKPTSNAAFWMRKLDRNRARDALVNRNLRKSGWRVLRIWQHDLGRPENVAKRVQAILKRAGRR
jgi:DNA mismatch endonuclease (patch repair protein)